jgi:hypothetical protein
MFVKAKKQEIDQSKPTTYMEFIDGKFLLVHDWRNGTKEYFDNGKQVEIKNKNISK